MQQRGSRMTYEEAIETIKIAKAEVERNYPLAYQIAFDMAIEALETQIPKKATVEPLYDKENPNPIDYYVMCECGKWICHPNEYEAKDNYKYCPKCGNRIEWDWSDEE